MTQHDELFAATGAEALLDMHGEKAVYRPKGGTPRPIVVIPTRHPVAPARGGQRDLAPLTIVKAVNDYHKGIAAAELNTGGDKIDLALKKGGRPTPRSIVKLLSDV